MVNYNMQPSCLQSNIEATKTNKGYANSSSHESMAARVCLHIFYHSIDHANNFLQYFLKHATDLNINCSLCILRIVVQEIRAMQV